MRPWRPETVKASVISAISLVATTPTKKDMEFAFTWVGEAAADVIATPANGKELKLAFTEGDEIPLVVLTPTTNCLVTC